MRLTDDGRRVPATIDRFDSPSRPEPPTMPEVVAHLDGRDTEETAAETLGRLTAAWWAIRCPDDAPAAGCSCDGPGCPFPTPVGRVYCSAACRERARYTPRTEATVRVSCCWCGDKFDAARSSARYCSSRCRMAAKRHRDNEAPTLNPKTHARAEARALIEADPDLDLVDGTVVRVVSPVGAKNAEMDAARKEGS